MTERADANFFVKPNEQSETCFDFAMARKNRRRQLVASLLLERGRALGWGRGLSLGPRRGGSGCDPQAEGLASLLFEASFGV